MEERKPDRSASPTGPRISRMLIGAGVVLVIFLGWSSWACRVTEGEIPGLGPTSAPGEREEESVKATAPVTPLTPGPTQTGSPTPTKPVHETQSPTTEPVLEPHIRPDQRHYELKHYMLELVNEVRENAGLHPVVLGDNIAAQLHAELSLRDCTLAHWGTDGLKHFMRYTLAGGFQATRENVAGHTYCIDSPDGYSPIDNTTSGLLKEMEVLVEGWMASPTHRDNILDPTHRKLNIGLAWDNYHIFAVQQFQGDYVEFDQPPTLLGGVLSFTGRSKNGARFQENTELIVYLHFDPPPSRLTRGQLSRTFCSDSGTRVAGIRYPLPDNQHWVNDSSVDTFKPCLSPYSVPADTRPPQSARESSRIHARAASVIPETVSNTVPWITASTWRIRDDSFEVEADVRSILDEYGSGVYTVDLRGILGGQYIVVAEYPIFHEIEPPDTYDPGQWDK